MIKKIIKYFFLFLFIFIFSSFCILFYKFVKHPTLSTNSNFLILGLDPRNDNLEKTNTTDTIMIARITPQWKINLISIPRDLWVYSLDTKVNEIYPLSLNSSNKFNYIETEFSKLTNQPISKTIIITTDALIKLTNMIGGVDVNLDDGFIDTQYPNPEYISNPSPKTPIYKTVEFKKGLVRLDESNITEFIRSRKSLNGGTDLGRILRQQLLIDAILSKIKSPQFYKNIDNLLSLYRFFHTELDSNLTDTDLISLGLPLYPHIQDIKLNKKSIPSGENPATDIIYHPTRFQNSQWVFIPQDKQYLSFQKFISDTLSF